MIKQVTNKKLFYKKFGQVLHFINFRIFFDNRLFCKAKKILIEPVWNLFLNFKRLKHITTTFSSKYKFFIEQFQ